MSMHKEPLTTLEREGLEKHGLPIGTPSQLADSFRLGVRWGLLSMAPTGAGEAERLEVEHSLDVLWHNQCVFVGKRLHRPGSEVFAEEFSNHPDKQSARRRATLRAAAAITQATQSQPTKKP